jgi:hypothetical protein
MTNIEIERLSNAVNAFMTKYPLYTSSDLQSFVMGWNAAYNLEEDKDARDRRTSQTSLREVGHVDNDRRYDRRYDSICLHCHFQKSCDTYIHERCLTELLPDQFYK